MSQTDALAAEPQGEPIKLDLSKYRTRELTSKVVELLSIRGAIARLLKSLILFELLVVLGVVALFYTSTLAYGWWFLACAYALLIGFAFGLVLGLLRIVAVALGHTEEILQINLEICRCAVSDAAALKTGGARPPTGAELIEMAHDQVLWPVIEEVICGALGFVGTPLLWIYRQTIARGVRRIIKLADIAALTKEKEAELQTGFTNGVTGVAQYAEVTDAYLVTALDVVPRVARAIRAYMMRPLYFLFYFSFFLASVPLLIVRYLATGEPVE